MTQAPTPGPLTVGDYAVRFEDHPLVKSGEVHRVTEMFRGGYLGFARPVGGEWNPSGWRKCDADGWMKFEGGDNPVPGCMVEWECHGMVGTPRLSDDLDWPKSSIIAFRLAPTAPVEASGSERALQDAVDFGVGFLVDGQRVAPERVTVCHGDNSPLRPQPSGETREEIVKILQRGMVSARSRMHGGGHSVIGLDMAATGQVFDDWDDANEALAGIRADAILALIRPAPVTSGGQHSSGEGEQ